MSYMIILHIPTLGDATDFGDLTDGILVEVVQVPTRGVSVVDIVVLVNVR